jgi:hypothetical protein
VQLNDPSQRALDRYLLHLSTQQAAHGENGYRAGLRRLVLNNCGITGYGAGRMFNAMTGLRDVHFYLNGNPLEVGIDHFCQAVGLCWKGLFGLHLDMLEFRDDANYAKLIKALTINKFIRFLSLVGTAPSPTHDAMCTPQVCEALEQFFALNKSVRFLDLSGYSGKLDEGQLAKGFGRSLRGLSLNKTITHLRLRNQNLHDDVGTLGSAVSENKTLRSLHFEDNNFNLTSLRYMAASLERNESIVDCPVSREEQSRILARCLRDVPKRKPPKKGAPESAVDAQVVMLRKEIERAAADAARHAQRNRAALEAKSGYVLDFSPSPDAGGEGWPCLELRFPDGATPTDAAEAAASAGRPRCTVRSSSIPPDVPGATPYRVGQDEETLHSPSGSSVGTPAGEGPPVTPESEKEEERRELAEAEARARGIDMGKGLEQMWDSLQLTEDVRK